jgi:hypothetical protein
MIKPSDLAPVAATTDAAHSADLERRFDKAITYAHNIGQWPARVPAYRDTIPYAAIEAAIQRYKDEGWVVDRAGPRDTDAIAYVGRPGTSVAAPTSRREDNLRGGGER